MQAWLRILVVFIFPGVAAAWCVYYQVDPDTAVWFTREDRPIQWLQVVFLAGATIYGLGVVASHGRHYHSRLVRNGFAVLVALLVFLILEETNWGQSVIGFATPEWIRGISGQGDGVVSVHNPVYFQRYRHWLIILFGAAGIILIVLANVLVRRGINKDLLFFAPPPAFVYTLVLIVCSGLFYEAAISGSALHRPSFSVFRSWAGRFTEIAELGVAVIAFSYAASKYHELVHGDDIPAFDED